MLILYKFKRVFIFVKNFYHSYQPSLIIINKELNDIGNWFLFEFINTYFINYWPTNVDNIEDKMVLTEKIQVLDLRIYFLKYHTRLNPWIWQKLKFILRFISEKITKSQASLEANTFHRRKSFIRL